MVLALFKEALIDDQVSFKADSSDFQNVYQHVELAEYEKAGELAISHIQSGCIDIRYLVYAVLGDWLNIKSFDGFGESLAAWMDILNRYLEIIEKGQCKSKVLFVTIEWLHQRFYDHATFLKTSQAEFPGDRKALEKTLEDYIHFIGENYASIEITPLRKILEVWQKIKIEEEVLEEEEVAKKEDGKEVLSESKSSDQATFISKSDKWRRLLQNIQLFQHLVECESWVKAAVVYQMITKALEKFDPIEYFPDIFYPYLNTTATAFNMLTQKSQLSSQPLWHVLETMFKSDPESFIEPESASNAEYMFEASDSLPMNREEVPMHDEISQPDGQGSFSTPNW